jgi:hypothetical protein
MNPLRGRCRCFSAVFSRALNYDTLLKDLSNLRVFADFAYRTRTARHCLVVLFSEALDSIPNFLSVATKTKILIVCCRLG